MNPIEVAKGISDYGMMAVSAAFFIVIAGSIMLFIIQTVKKFMNNIMIKQNETLNKLLEETQKQNALLSTINEGLSDETLSQVKCVASAIFDLNKQEVCKIISRIKDENNLANRDYVKGKIRRLLQNIHGGRNGKFDLFSYRGRRLSTYTNTEWVDTLLQIVEDEIYAEKYNSGRAYSNISAAYEDIKNNFYRKLMYN